MRRDRTEIIRDILMLCKQPMLRSHIMGQAHLSWTQNEFYVARLLKDGYLEISGKRGKHNLYKTSEKGLKSLKIFGGLVQISKEFEGLPK